MLSPWGLWVWYPGCWVCEVGVSLETEYTCPPLQVLGGGFISGTVNMWLKVQCLGKRLTLETVDLRQHVYGLGGGNPGDYVHMTTGVGSGWGVTLTLWI